MSSGDTKKPVALVVIGAQGSGKSTQARVISRSFKLPIYQSGEQLRLLAVSSDPLASEVKGLIRAGKFVSDEIVERLVRRFLVAQQSRSGIIFDGFPRNLTQCQTLNRLSNEYGWRLIGLYVKISDQTALERISQRVVTVNGRQTVRDDDRREIAAKRLALFHRTTAPVLDWLKANHRLIEIDGESPIGQVSQSIFASLQETLFVDQVKLTAIRQAGKIASNLNHQVREMIKPGVTGLAIEKTIADGISAAGMRPAFLGYNGYPYASCISINSAVVHGLPTEKKLRPGDLVSVDLGVEHQGWIVDTARTYPVGKIEAQLNRLLFATETALDQAIKLCRDGVKTGTIGAKINQVVTDNGFAVVRELSGHGVGRNLQERPSIPNFGRPDDGERLKTGQTIALEPITTLTATEVTVADDGWTVRAKNDLPSAHFEDTIMITGGEPIILTR